MNYCSRCGNKISVNVQQPAHLTEKFEQAKRTRYGKHKGYFKWDLAVAWFNMSNDDFFNLYGFNFVPRGLLFEESRDHAFHKREMRAANEVNIYQMNVDSKSSDVETIARSIARSLNDEIANGLSNSIRMGRY